MRLHNGIMGLSIAALVGSGPVFATDAWDLGTDPDDTAGGTDNTLWHTAPPQQHDLQAVGGVADQDWFRIFPRAKRSYEVLVLNVAGDTGANVGTSGELLLTRRNAAGTTLLQTGIPLDEAGAGGAQFMRSLRWIAGADSDERILVTNNITTSTSGAIYTILLRETTLYCPRYNNTGSQTSVLILQRTNADTATSCNYTVHFFNETGSEVGSTTSSLSVIDDVDVISTAGVSGVGGQKGGAHIAHTCGVGGFKAKLVALEPSTGFSFDTQCGEKDR
jgi:hypothetical protein